MPTVQEWRKTLQEEMLGPYSDVEDRSGRTDGHRLSERIEALPRDGEDRKNVFEATLRCLRVNKLSLQGTLTLSVCVLEVLMPLLEHEKEGLCRMVIEECLPRKAEKRGYLLRLIALERVEIDWRRFVLTENWIAIDRADPLLAADILVYAGEFELARECISIALREARTKQKYVLHMAGRWKDLPESNNQPKEDIEAFLASLPK